MHKKDVSSDCHIVLPIGFEQVFQNHVIRLPVEKQYQNNIDSFLESSFQSKLQV